MQRRASCIGLIATLAWCASCVAATKVELPAIRFYEGKSATEKNVCTIGDLKPDDHLTVNFGAGNNPYGCDNDEAQSMKLQNMPAGTIIKVYDSPDCGDDDDWQRTTVVQSRIGIDVVVPTFETEWPNPQAYSEATPIIDAFKWATTLTLHYDNSLNGKVSCVKIDLPGVRP
jgi:hypothetical protein